MARNVSVAFVIALFGSGVALAGDPPGQAAEQVEVRLAVKAGDTFRFRQTEASSTEVDGKPYKAEESAQEYSVAVKSVRPDGGLDVALTFEAIRAKLLDRGTGAWTELDTSKPLPEGSAMKAQAMDALSRAMVGRPIAVTLDAHGVPTAVSGLRDAVSAGIKGTPFEQMLPVDKIFTDADGMKLVADLFAGAPAGPHAVGAKWSGEAEDEVSSQSLDFTAEWTLTAATADDAIVTSKLTWKPGKEAFSDGAKPVGGGDATTKFSRKDGLVLSMKKHLEANRDTGAMKATSHTDSTIERLPAKAAEPAKPADPKKPDPSKK